MPHPAPTTTTIRKYVHIAIINASTVVSDTEGDLVTRALQVQVDSDFGPIYGVSAQLVYVPKGHTPPSNYWWLTILDSSDVAGALGYHDMTNEGQPIGKIFAGTDKQYGASWSVTASHELLEMLQDPWVNITALVQTSNNAGRIWAYEVCDACEADQYGYHISSVGNVLVSDFVYPEFFFAQPVAGAKYDHMNLITRPFQLLPGGYLSFLDLTSKAGWQQVQADGAPHARSRPPVGSRRERRAVGSAAWQRSQVVF